jgi:hypothetical protein
MPSAVTMAPKLTKNAMRRAKKKEQKKAAQVSVDFIYFELNILIMYRLLLLQRQKRNQKPSSNQSESRLKKTRIP